MKIYHIYKITNLINGKIYIGQTSLKRPINRFHSHKSEAKRGVQVGRFYHAIRKYGAENFKFELILCCRDQESCNEMEQLFISYYKSTVDSIGYNVEIGGHSPLSEESLVKMRNTIKQQFEDGRKSWNTGLAGKGTYKLGKPWNAGKSGYKCNNGEGISKALSGKPKSEEHRRKLSEAKKEYHRNKKRLETSKF